MQADLEQAAHTKLNVHGVCCHGTMRCNTASSILRNSNCSVWNFGLAARGQVGASDVIRFKRARTSATSKFAMSFKDETSCTC